MLKTQNARILAEVLDEAAAEAPKLSRPALMALYARQALEAASGKEGKVVVEVPTTHSFTGEGGWGVLHYLTYEGRDIRSRLADAVKDESDGTMHLIIRQESSRAILCVWPDCVGPAVER